MKLLVYFLVLLSMTFVVFGAPDVENVSITPSPVLFGSDINCSYDWVGPGVDNSSVLWFVNEVNVSERRDCYHEYANVSDCGTLRNGIYYFVSSLGGDVLGTGNDINESETSWTNISNLYDGNSSSYAIYNPDHEANGFTDFWINYTKRPGFTSDSVWQVRDGAGIANLSLSEECFYGEIHKYTSNGTIINYTHHENIRLYVRGGDPSTTNQSYWRCVSDKYFYFDNGTLQTSMPNSITALRGVANSAEVYEEQMIWDIDEWFVGDNLTCEVTPINTTGTVGTKVNSSNETVLLYTNLTFVFNDPVLHTTRQNFEVSFDVSNTSITSVSSYLLLNNSNTNATSVISGNDVSFNLSNLVMPQLSATNQSFNFTWNWNGTIYGSFSFDIAVTNSTLVSYFGVDNCSTYSTVAVNYSLLKEDDDSALTGPVDLFYNVTLPNSSYYPGFALDFAGRTYYEACIFPSWASTTTDIQGVYSSSGYSERSYYADDYVLDSTLSSVSLYLVENTSVVQFTVLGTEGNGVSGAYVHIYKYDPGSHTTILSQVLNTDSDGVAYGEIVLDTEWYTFIVMYDGEIELETSPTKVTSVTKTFRINPDTDYYDEYEDAFSISNSLDYFSLSTYFSFVYIDNSGKVNQGCLKVVRNSVRGEQVMNDTCVSGATGVINYYVPASPGDFDYTATSYVIFNTGEEFVLDSETVSFTDLHETYGVEGLFIAVLILIALAAAGIAHPSMSIAFVCFGLVAVIALGLFKISWVSAVSLVIIGGLAIYRVGTK